jgi:hypothetical protein
MLRLATSLAFLLITSAAHTATGGSPETPEPVNVIVESGRDIGPCGGGGRLSYPPAPFKGSAYFLLKADSRLAARHESLTRAHLPWLRRLNGPSGTNRLFTTPTGQGAIVFWSCKAGDCGANIAYGAYEPAAGRYLLRARQNGALLPLGEDTPVFRSAITCAEALDNRARDASIEALKGISGR